MFRIFFITMPLRNEISSLKFSINTVSLKCQHSSENRKKRVNLVVKIFDCISWMSCLVSDAFVLCILRHINSSFFFWGGVTSAAPGVLICFNELYISIRQREYTFWRYRKMSDSSVCVINYILVLFSNKNRYIIVYNEICFATYVIILCSFIALR